MKSSSKKDKIDLSKLYNKLLILLLCLTFGFGGGWLGARSYVQTDGGSLAEQTSQQIILNESQLINGIAEDVGPSVVSLEVTGQSGGRSFFGFYDSFETAGAGTGIILSSDGYVITNRHVVPEGTTKVTVVLSDGTRLSDVELVGRTKEGDSLDIAFLKINDNEGHELTPAPLGKSNELKVGDRVVAIGNALGEFQNSVTAGIISGFGRSVVAGDYSSSESLINLIQTDAAINEGNSGGPLVNVNGEVIGINTAIAGGDAQNIGFAIPIDDISTIIQVVLETGELNRPYLGVRYVSLDESIAEAFEIEQTTGAYIVESRRGNFSILPGSPAEKAGLQEKDIILKVDGEDVTKDNTLSSIINKTKVGDTVTLEIIRGEETLFFEVTLESTTDD